MYKKSIMAHFCKISWGLSLPILLTPRSEKGGSQRLGTPYQHNTSIAVGCWVSDFRIQVECKVASICIVNLAA
jgi:hypothetical protein